jgi:hypothetical protein
MNAGGSEDTASTRTAVFGGISWSAFTVALDMDAAAAVVLAACKRPGAGGQQPECEDPSSPPRRPAAVMNPDGDPPGPCGR